MTNAEFLNENFGTNYKQWMKCGWYYDDKKEILVWMVNFNKTVSSGKGYSGYVDAISKCIAEVSAEIAKSI